MSTLDSIVPASGEGSSPPPKVENPSTTPAPRPAKPRPLCAVCKVARPAIVRPKNQHRLCKECFLKCFETEIHETIVANKLFERGERVAIGASGGKDSTVLASVMKTLNERYDYGVDFVLLSIDEGIKGYRDDSLETVKRNAKQYDMKLLIVGYEELYGGWTMDKVVKEIGKKGNCTVCGVFRRQALDRGAEVLGIKHVVTGHNADDIAETVLMNLLRGDLPRLQRCTAITTSSSGSSMKRSKPLKYAYEKEIVMYAHFKKLDYFTTECIYSPEAFRGSARTLIKKLEKARARSIMDIIISGEDFAKQIPTSDAPLPAEEAENSCGNPAGGSMIEVERRLEQEEEAAELGLETEITLPPKRKKKNKVPRGPPNNKGPKPVKTQTMGTCKKCGYLTSQEYCKACVLLEGLNKGKPKVEIEMEQITQKLKDKLALSETNS